MKDLMLSALALAIAVLFVGSCLLTAIDGQGGIVFLISLPVIFMLFGVAFYLMLPQIRFKVFWPSIFIFELIIILMFALGIVVPKLRPFTVKTTNAVNFTLEKLTGMDPYFWSKQNSALSEKVTQQLGATRELHERHFSIDKEWNRLCIFAHPTSEAQAASVIGFYSTTMERSRAYKSDKYTALVYLDEKGTLEVLDIPRKDIDLTSLAGECYEAKDFPLRL